jgi:hypothetical protein
VERGICCLGSPHTIHVVHSVHDVVEVAVAQVGHQLHIGGGHRGAQPAPHSAAASKTTTISTPLQVFYLVGHQPILWGWMEHDASRLFSILSLPELGRNMM